MREEGSENYNSAAKTLMVNLGNCPCRRLAMFVLDISRAVSHKEVEWLEFQSNASLQAPEETILYSLVAGRAELIMFGGIQKDVAQMSGGGAGGSAGGPGPESDTVSNEVYFLTPPSRIV